MAGTAFSERLKQVVGWTKLKQVQFAAEIQVPVTTLSGAIRGIHKNVSQTVINKIALRYPEVDIDWLITGKGSLIKRNPVHNNTHTAILQVRATDFQKYLSALKETGQALADAEALYYPQRSKETLRNFEVTDNSLAEAPALLNKGDFIRTRLLSAEQYRNEALLGRLCIVVADDIYMRFITGFEANKTFIKLSAANKLYRDIEIAISGIHEVWLYEGFYTTREIRLVL